jgi:hypothetical protein
MIDPTIGEIQRGWERQKIDSEQTHLSFKRRYFHLIIIIYQKIKLFLFY